jgi:uncharacterized protein YbjT (DUF2867 family)
MEGLLAENVQVRASSRDPQQARMPTGVELAAADLNQPDTMARALGGVSAVFLYAQGKKLPELMATTKEVGVEYVVFLSTIDATNQHDYAQHNRRRHLEVEEAVAAAGFRYTFLRPAAFATNALRFWRQSIVAEGVVRIPFPEAQQAPIDERDIAAVGVRALASRKLDGAALVLTGPESLTQRKQLECISNVVGRPIRLETMTEEQARAWLEKIIPVAYVNLLIAQWRDEVGAAARVTDNVERVTGRPVTPYAAGLRAMPMPSAWCESILPPTPCQWAAEALVPSAENSKYKVQSLEASPAGANFHWRAACKARFAKYWLGPGESIVASVTLPEGSTLTWMPTLTVPRIVPMAFCDTSGRTW